MVIMRLMVLVTAVLATGCGTQGYPKVVYLARHGQTEWNRVHRWQGDPDLDQVGYINRVNLWNLLKKEPIAAVYASERLRTQRTAELVAKQHKLTTQVRADLNEIDSGIAAGVCFAQFAPHKAKPGDLRRCAKVARGSRPDVTLKVLRKAYKKLAKDRTDGKMPLGESLADVVTKTKRFVDELSRGYTKRQVLVVGHGVVNRALLHHIMDWPLERVARLKQENDQVYKFEFAGKGKPKLWLYTPGSGWKRCKAAPKKGRRYMNCNPYSKTHGPKKIRPAQTVPGAPAPQAKPVVPEPTPSKTEPEKPQAAPEKPQAAPEKPQAAPEKPAIDSKK